MAIRPYLAMSSEEIADFGVMPEHAAWMFCPFGREDWPQKDQLPEKPRLVLTDQKRPEEERAAEMGKILAQWDPEWVILDFQKTTGSSFAEALLKTLPCPVAVSETCGRDFSGPVFLPPVPLHRRLEDYILPWKGREIWLDLSVEGERITLTEAGAQIERLPFVPPPVKSHRDERLHCHYSITLWESSAEFTLWRTEEDIRALIREAESLGIRNVLGLYQEWQGSGAVGI